MNTTVFVYLTLLAVIVASAEDNYRGPSEADVIVLDSTNLESTIFES